MPSNDRYSATAIALHWLIFALIAGGFALAVYMVDLPLSPAKLKYFSWHKWTGITIFLLALARVAWRRRTPPIFHCGSGALRAQCTQSSTR